MTGASMVKCVSTLVVAGLISAVVGVGAVRGDDPIVFTTADLVPLQPMQPVLPPLKEVTERFGTDEVYAGSLKGLIAGVKSTRFEERENSQDRLMHLPASQLSELAQALMSETDPEGILRLTTVVSHLYLKARTPVGPQSGGEPAVSLLGIRFRPVIFRPDAKKPEDVRMCIEVDQLQPGYPAAQELKEGDRIMEVDGKPFPLSTQDEEFKNIVRSHRPGSTMRCVVMRQGERVAVDVQLAALPAGTGDNITQAITQRDEALRNYLKSLHVFEKEPLMVRADTEAANGEQLRVLQDGTVLVLPRLNPLDQPVQVQIQGQLDIQQIPALPAGR
jgi:hypothetical protein